MSRSEHIGEQTVQARVGVRIADWGSARTSPVISPAAAGFLSERSFVVLGAAANEGSMWATMLAGRPGFVGATGERTLVIDRLPEAPDPLAGLFEDERDIGMVAIDLETRRRIRVNGIAVREESGLTVRTEQVYGNCPKYIQVRESTEVASGRRQVRHSRVLTDAHRAQIRNADTFFIATRADGVGADVSHRGGNPGFVTATDGQRLSWPDYSGNFMYMTLGNLELDPRCGLLFLDWESGGALHISGRAAVDWDPARAAATPGAQRMIDFDVEQVVDIDAAVGLRWTLGDYSRFNPA
ncbi:pyridoxamine 5'-phosphate oxidase family protein [Antrihabitans spumae]|uniref:Pyridoxamine 5'-phosphate oxidase family protein n=1 Tax=Antrihabitans spumae TaxID=3373370 RepID=A0ABW7KHS5_9NOCA